MPTISIILSCYNGDKFLEEALNSFINQTFIDWEMIFVNDGSSDKSLEVVEMFAQNESRIRIYSKENGGINSARNFGFQFISEESKFLIFSDADDILSKDFLLKLYTALNQNDSAGAVYCNYRLIDPSGKPISKANNCNRYIPSKFWVRALDLSECYTPFASIFTWTPMIEPMTLIKKEMFNQYGNWDEINFPKGDSYGESIPLFGEIALNHRIIFLSDELYSYRTHANQITNKAVNMKKVNMKIDRIWKQRVSVKPIYKSEVHKAIIFRDYRLPFPFYLKGSFKYELRFEPFNAIKHTFNYFLKYIYSLPHFLNRD